MEHRTPGPAAVLPMDDLVRCSRQARFLAAMDDFYSDLDARIASHQPVCRNRGDCCRFGDYGHRLFVTSAEVAYFLARAAGPVLDTGLKDACPYQQNGLCAVRSARPSGCRIFFCDPAGQAWQSELTEHVLADLRHLHEQLTLAYAYVDWMAALRSLQTI